MPRIESERETRFKKTTTVFVQRRLHSSFITLKEMKQAIKVKISMLVWVFNDFGRRMNNILIQTMKNEFLLHQIHIIMLENVKLRTRCALIDVLPHRRFFFSINVL